MSRPVTSVAAGAALLALLSSFAPPAAAEVTITMNVVMPRASSFFIGVYKPWADAVEQESQGRIKVAIPAATMAPLARQWEMVTSGIADVALTPNDYIRERVKLPFLAEIPFIAPNSVADTVAIWRTQEKYFAKVHEYKGVKLLGIWVNGGNTVQTVKRPITKLDDFHGLKIWVPSPNIKAAIEAFGATPVAAQAANSMYDYMSGGIVDGAVTGKGSLISFQLARFTKYLTLFAGQLGYNSFSFFMNEKKYESLSPQDRAVIDKVSYEGFSRRAAQGFVDQDNRANALIEQNHIDVIHASPEFMAAARAKVPFFKEEWLAAAKQRGIDGPGAYEYFVKTAQDVAAGGK
ncbi:MAG TPA: TRAP transporter substrate-binding protein [Stellaceae bacterium]|nr:TRAP transporter substrate-binding protein [Stellaceae bacterium]